ncbi:MAG TPA: hypothetical protein VFQ65_07930 [Kofleriaceae bacterium]|nr:hypothetical protein [Kofleriaceae bacterium]
MMKLEDVRPADCYAHAQRVLADAGAIRIEMGRSEDSRSALELTDAKPRECYFAALATWQKVTRLAVEVGASLTTHMHEIPALREVRPGHVLKMIEAVQLQVDSIKRQLQIAETAALPATEATRQPADVLVTLIQINRQVSRALERPFTPSDVYATVSIASAYAAHLGGTATPASFERRRTPRHCYERLMACHAATAKRLAKHGESSVAMRVVPADVLPGDVHDIANLVLGEVALLNSLTANVPVVYPFNPSVEGRWLPSHVDQLARTLEAQLATP